MSPLKPSSQEDEYFARQDAIKKRKLAFKVRDEMAESERTKLKELHYMHCPKCGMKMDVIEINDIEIDKCFACGGMYFDDGELEKVSGRESNFFKNVQGVFKDE
jgi:hypothetical protein